MPAKKTVTGKKTGRPKRAEVVAKNKKKKKSEKKVGRALSQCGGD